MSNYSRISGKDVDEKSSYFMFLEHENLCIFIPSINILIQAFLSHERCIAYFQGKILSVVLLLVYFCPDILIENVSEYFCVS